ncbi:probable serine/threonine-protein kinase PBL11 [Salvia hispanica]|uniref:probable serine/threonine-protein kinase PBL11 n=1 Tax=Salvia hispanica TaxID=49212 RepID=UPI002009D5AE|nr:probable serine/threonine-protein kinase PBL11 [Salvia hispanica]
MLEDFGIAQATLSIGCDNNSAFYFSQVYHERSKHIDANIQYFSQLRHPNLIKLIGYSFNEDSKILVYEFMGKGSLENQLFTIGWHNSLNWATRVNVAIGAARAIAFLHDLEKPVIHGNIMSSKILIDRDFTAKLSTFGFARDGPIGDRTHVSTRITGTYGH